MLFRTSTTLVVSEVRVVIRIVAPLVVLLALVGCGDHRVSIRVLDANGAPIPDVGVGESGLQEPHDHLTDASGRAELDVGTKAGISHLYVIYHNSFYNGWLRPDQIRSVDVVPEKDEWRKFDADGKLVETTKSSSVNPKH